VTKAYVEGIEGGVVCVVRQPLCYDLRTVITNYYCLERTEVFCLKTFYCLKIIFHQVVRKVELICSKMYQRKRHV
jgi:hypothetical protein